LKTLAKGPKSLQELNNELSVSEPTINKQRKILHEEGKIEPAFIEGSKKWVLVVENLKLPHNMETEVKQLTDFLRENSMLKDRGNSKKLDIDTDDLEKIIEYIKEQEFDTIGENLKEIDHNKDGIPKEDFISLMMELSQILTNVESPKFDLDERGISVRFKGDITSLFATPELDEFRKELSLHQELEKDDIGRYKEVEETVECSDCGEEISEGEKLYCVRDRDFNISKEICESCRKKDVITDNLDSDTK